MILFAYTMCVVAGAAFVSAGCIVPAIIALLVALVMAARFELRWLLDHTSLTKAQQPRRVPHSPRYL